MYDAVIVGGGPAGLSAALILGRCRRRVLVCDVGRPRNRAARALHGYLTRDGIPPLELRRLGRRELEPYGVDYHTVEVTEATRVGDRFRCTLGTGEAVESRFLVLATGVVDVLPPIEGLAELYGRSVHHCPYCDGWEVRDRPLAALGRGKDGFGLAVSLRTWSDDVVLCTDGPHGLRNAQRATLTRLGVALRTERIARLEGRAGLLQRIVFVDGRSLPRRALFFKPAKYQRSPLCEELGCSFTRKGAVRVLKHEKAGPEGLFVIGDASQDIQMAIIAAAEGVRAGHAINESLSRRSLGPDR